MVRRNLVGQRRDCKTCLHGDPKSPEQIMQQPMSLLNRQLMGCGYAPPPPAPIKAEPSVACGYNGPDLTVCPGYSTSLPEVIEVAKAHAHWSKGALRVDDVESPMANALLILEGANNILTRWLSTPKDKDGGME